MASVIATVKSEAVGGRLRKLSLLPGSRLGRLIIVLNLLGLMILIGGALVLNELSRGLINAKIDSLKTQGAFIVSVLEQTATRGEPDPALDADSARDTLQVLFIPNSQRARIFDASGALIADSYVIADRVEWKPLPPARKRGAFQLRWLMKDTDARPEAVAKAKADLAREIDEALKGQPVAGLRRAQNGARVVSVSLPIRIPFASRKLTFPVTPSDTSGLDMKPKPLDESE